MPPFQEPLVLNKRFDIIPAGAIYIGRPSVWGNPFSHLPNTLAKYKVNTRDEAVDSYEKMVLNDPALIEKIKAELKGKHLVCWCNPNRCHGHILKRIANE